MKRNIAILAAALISLIGCRDPIRIRHDSEKDIARECIELEESVVFEDLFQAAITNSALRPDFVMYAAALANLPKNVTNVSYVATQQEDDKTAMQTFTEAVCTEGGLSDVTERIEIMPYAFNRLGYIKSANDFLSCLGVHEKKHCTIYANNGEPILGKIRSSNGSIDLYLFSLLSELEACKEEVESATDIKAGVLYPREDLTQRYVCHALDYSFSEFSKLVALRDDPNMDRQLIDMLVDEYRLPHYAFCKGRMKE